MNGVSPVSTAYGRSGSRSAYSLTSAAVAANGHGYGRISSIQTD
jgi:hypothetical protein